MTEDRSASTPCCIAIFGKRSRLSVRTSILITKRRSPDADDSPDEQDSPRGRCYTASSMTGLELRRAAGGSTELKAYDGEHDMAMDEVREDRLHFLEDALGYGGASTATASAR